MYDSNPGSQAFRSPTARHDRIARPSAATATMPAPEAKLLGVIERALEQQRASRDAVAEVPPLVSRIETILGKRLEAANDVEAAAADPLPAAPAPEVWGSTKAAASLNQATSAVGKGAPKSGRLKPLAMVGLICALGAASGTLIPAEPTRYSAEGGTRRPRRRRKSHCSHESDRKDAFVSPYDGGNGCGIETRPRSEFSGVSSDALAVAIDLLSTDGAAADPVSRAEASLASAIRTVTDPHAGTIDFKVTTGSAAEIRAHRRLPCVRRNGLRGSNCGRPKADR